MTSATDNNTWYHDSPSNTVFVFAHGIFSSSRTCWLWEDRSAPPRSVFWPDLVISDPRVGAPAIFLSGYPTSVSSGDLLVRNCAREVLDGLRLVDDASRRPPLERLNLIFIAHSTGGIVIRYMLERFKDDFRGKNIGLLLIASPSLGSVYANRLSLLAEFYNQQLGLQLRWGDESLAELDGRFKDLVQDDEKPFKLYGRECYEHYFILRKQWLPAWLERLLPNRRKLVDRLSAGRYFGEPRLLSGTDHFTTVKPSDEGHVAHQQLVLFKKDFDAWCERFTRPSDTGRGPRVTIDEPRSNETVKRTIHCSGSATSVQSNMHLWLAVEANGFVWPKEGEVYVDKDRWSSTIFEDGATKKFSIALLIANPDANKIIREWLEEGRRKGEYAEMKGIPGTERVARVDGLRLRGTSL